ncbi:MAG: hypothetical protein V4488_25330 [Pseudomonadota bacterium]
MHSSTVLTASQTFHFHARKGSIIYLKSGSATIAAAPVWLETPYFEPACLLCEGGTFVVRHGGWIAVSARQGCEVVYIVHAAAQGWRQRLSAKLGIRVDLGRLLDFLNGKATG